MDVCTIGVRVLQYIMMISIQAIMPSHWNQIISDRSGQYLNLRKFPSSLFSRIRSRLTFPAHAATMSSSKAVKPKGSATASSSRNLTPVLNSPSLNLDEPDENDDDSEDNDAWDEVDVVNDQAAAGIDIVLSKTNGSSKTKSKQFVLSSSIVVCGSSG